MNTTKRKFNTLLQGLGSSATSDKHISPSTSSPAISSNGSRFNARDSLKRRRLGHSASATASSTSLSSSLKGKTSRSGLFPHRPTESSAGTDGQPEVLAKYCPSDREQLIKRMATFQELTDWTPKPEKLSEVEWAKRGWICKSKETVRCVLCHKELVVKLNRKELDDKEAARVASEIEEALVDKYAGLIVLSHQEDCLWRKRGCEDSLLRLSLASSKGTLDTLRQRYDELCSRKSFLPYESNLRLPEGLDLDKVLDLLPPDFFNTSTATDESADTAPNRPAIALALLGWQGLTNTRIGPVPNSASCHTCLRRLGLWMFKTKEIDADGNVVTPAPMDHLDPVREHRSFCPWKNAASQSRGTASKNQDVPSSASKLLIQTLQNEAHLRSVYRGQSRPQSRSTRVETPSTPSRASKEMVPPQTPLQVASPSMGNLESPNIGGDGDDDDKERDVKDKERWARLRRVKSLFESKASRKLKRPSSRPATSHTTTSER